jgi:light-regulated signal transduction histidine kinase (bacteriophytochrome)
MHTLVNDLLSYLRVESKSQLFSVLSLRDSFNDPVMMLESSIVATRCEITCGELPVVCGDRSPLAQVFQNFIGNAIKYRSAKDPRLHVSCERQDDRWLISVRATIALEIPRINTKKCSIFSIAYTPRKLIPARGLASRVDDALSCVTEGEFGSNPHRVRAAHSALP